jgi:biotin carboxylase
MTTAPLYRARGPSAVRGPAALSEPAVVLIDPVMNGLPFKRACADLGYPVVGIYTLEPSQLKSVAPAHLTGDALSLYGSDPDALAVELATAAERVHAIVPTTEPGTQIAAILAERLGVPTNPAVTAGARRDKRAMRALARDRGIRIPRFEIAAGPAVAAAARRIGLPVIVKAPTGAGAHNVNLISGESDLPPLDGAPRRDQFGNQIDQWLVEEYVRGQEFAVNTFSFGGQHIVIDTWEYQRPDAADYDMPYWDFVQVARNPQVEQFALDVLNAFEVELGPAHVEVKLSTDGPVFIEIGARLPGAGIAGLWERHSTFRPYHDTLTAYLRRRPVIADQLPRFAGRPGICFIPHEGPSGILRALDGLDKVRELAGVDAVSCSARVGEHVRTTRHLGSELVKIELCAPSGAGLRDLIATVRGLVSVRVEAG